MIGFMMLNSWFQNAWNVASTTQKYTYNRPTNKQPSENYELSTNFVKENLLMNYEISRYLISVFNSECLKC